MSFRDHFPALSWIWRALTGLLAQRVYLMAVLLVLVTSAAVRVYTYVLTRRMEAVISGLSKLEIDKTSEEEMARTVPYLVRSQSGGQIKRNAETGDIDTGTARYYYVTITNESSWMAFGSYITPLISCCVKLEFTKDGYERGWIFTLTDLIGYRYIYFAASVTLLDGKVSRISYGVADRLGFPRQIFQIVSVKSAHSFYGPHESGFEVRSTDDESPQFRVNGGEHGIGVSYTFDAPRNLTSHAFQVDLTCFWRLRGCHHVRQIAPLLWQDKNAIDAAALARLRSVKPCPDRILTGRVRYLPDVDLLLLESKGFRAETVEIGTQREDGFTTSYKLVETLRGSFSKNLGLVWTENTIPFPGDYTRRLPNMGLRFANAGERVLAFSNHNFDSCGIVAATPSALSSVRNTTPAPRRSEDQLVWGLR